MKYILLLSVFSFFYGFFTYWILLVYEKILMFFLGSFLKKDDSIIKGVLIGGYFYTFIPLTDFMKAINEDLMLGFSSKDVVTLFLAMFVLGALVFFSINKKARDSIGWWR